MLGYESSDKETACESNSRRTGGHRRCNSNTDAADPDCDAATVSREAVAEFAAAIRRTGHWNFEGGDLVPELLTALPSWRHSGLILEILEDGHNPVVLGGNDRGTIVTQIIRVRRINDSHYRAVVDGMDVDLGANGDCFFYSVWYALETSVPEEERRRIYHSNLPSGRVEAAAFLRNAIADYSVAHGDEVGDFLTHTQPKPTSGIKSDGSETHATETSADNSARSSGWSETVPFALREIGRSLFHSAKSLSSTLGWTLLLGQGVRTIFEWLPLNYWPFQFYFLCDALINRREYLGAFLSLLEFDAIITGSSNTEVFDFQDPKFAGYLDTWLGSSTTSQKNGVWSGTWGSEHFLNEKFSIVEIRGEKSAVSAIRINLNKVRENHPLIISSGELSGSTIAFAVSGKGSDQYLYVFHAGHKSGDEVWKVSEQGVTDIYNAHRAMDGRPLKDLGVSDDGTPVEENGTPLSYRTLQQILGNYERGFVAYSGEMPNAPAADITASTAVEWVDYAQGDIVPTSGNGHAYALLTKQGETVDVKFYAGKSPAMKIGRDGKPKIKY